MTNNDRPTRLALLTRPALAVLIAALALTACGRRDSPAAEPGAAATTGSEPSPSEPAPSETAPALADTAPADTAPTDEAISRVMRPWTGDLPQMAERRYVRMLVTFSRTHYYLDQADQHGLVYEAGKAFEAFLNDRLKLKNPMLHVVFIPTSRDRIFQDLAAGRGDLAAAGLTITPERQRLVDFGPPVFSNVREVVVTGIEQPAVTTADDLSGRAVHVRRSSSFYDSLVALNRTLLARGREPVTIVEAPEALEDEDLLEMIDGGLIPATIVDDYVAAFWRQLFARIRVHDAAVRTDGQIAWAVRKNAPELREAVAEFMRANPKGSRTFNILYQKYLTSTKFVQNATRDSELRKFREIRGFFEKYGTEYDLPWLLLAAQGYQESQLDQRKRSHVGAVGVMQIKPSTAAGPPINIKGVDASAQRNIEAGAKYLRFIVDQYYADEPMDRLNRGLFAIASYNAGPARIARLREKAARMGLDENRWFGNVEVVAAREIGRETVNYVSNIYKYYVAYNLVMQQTEQRRKARGG